MLCQDIDFNIDFGPVLIAVQGGVAVGVGNDGECDLRAFDLSNGEAHAVDC